MRQAWRDKLPKTGTEWFSTIFCGLWCAVVLSGLLAILKWMWGFILR